ncbi:hypothetical protein M422DRAFT_57060, partial [Sphaerobolus stellatus SS14]
MSWFGICNDVGGAAFPNQSNLLYTHATNSSRSLDDPSEFSAPAQTTISPHPVNRPQGSFVGQLERIVSQYTYGTDSHQRDQITHRDEQPALASGYYPDQNVIHSRPEDRSTLPLSNTHYAVPTDSTHSSS